MTPTDPQAGLPDRKERRHGAPAARPASTVPDEAILEALDFEHEVPCEYERHHEYGDGRAVYLVNVKCRHCPRQTQRAMCNGCFIGATSDLLCGECFGVTAKHAGWRIVRVIGGAS